MSDIIQSLRLLVSETPNFDTEESSGQIWAHPRIPGGISVYLFEGGDTFQVGYEGWHEHIDDADRAFKCFAFGLQGECRLQITLRGKMECAWTLQVPDGNGGGWKDDSTTGLLLVPWWRAKRTEIRQNYSSVAVAKQ